MSRHLSHGEKCLTLTSFISICCKSFIVTDLHIWICLPGITKHIVHCVVAQISSMRNSRNLQTSSTDLIFKSGSRRSFMEIARYWCSNLLVFTTSRLCQFLYRVLIYLVSLLPSPKIFCEVENALIYEAIPTRNHTAYA